MGILRSAAHVRHQVVSQSLWWWCPPMRLLSGVAHAEYVDWFYDEIIEYDVNKIGRS